MKRRSHPSMRRWSGFNALMALGWMVMIVFGAGFLPHLAEMFGERSEGGANLAGAPVELAMVAILAADVDVCSADDQAADPSLFGDNEDDEDNGGGDAPSLLAWSGTLSVARSSRRDRSDASAAAPWRFRLRPTNRGPPAAPSNRGPTAAPSNRGPTAV